MKLFNYMWFRIAKLYIKKDGDGITASAFVSLCQGALISSIVKVLTGYEIIKIDANNPLLKNFVPGVIFSLLFLNYFHYRKNYWQFREYWKDEPKGIIYILKG